MSEPFQDTLALTRDCEAILIPQGTALQLKKGSMVTIMQRLGPHFTVQVYNNLVRIRGQDADALQIEPVEVALHLSDDATFEDKVWACLSTCFDPEIPVNIVDLGLIYDVRLRLNDHGRYSIHVVMTLTAPGCGMGPILLDDVKHAVQSLKEVEAVEVELVFDPPWDRSRISEAARLQLGL